MPKPTPQWVPNKTLATGRLAWIAARPILLRRSTPWWAVPLRILGASSSRSRSGPGYARDLSSETTSGRMASYSVPVDTVAARLSPAEVAALRERGTLPEWFFDAVEEERKVFLRSLK